MNEMITFCTGALVGISAGLIVGWLNYDLSINLKGKLATIASCIDNWRVSCRCSCDDCCKLVERIQALTKEEI